MKIRILFTVMLLLLGTVSQVLAGSNIMKVKDATVISGTVATIEVEIINEDAFAGFNFDIPLPTGFSYVEGTATLYRDNGHSFTFGIVSGNVARCISFAIPTTNFTGNNGVVVSFDVQTPFTAGSYTLNIANAVITDSGGNNILTAVYPGTVLLQTLPAAVPLDVKVILEGAYTPGGANLMQTSLNAAGVIPLAHPFQPALPYFGNNNPVWYYNGTETASTVSANVVDWVLLELRDAATPGQAVSGTIIKRMAAFLYNDGQIRTIAGQLPMVDILVSQGLYVVVYHRNHLAVMSSAAVPVIGGNYTWNFTQSFGKAYSVNKTNSKSAYLQGHKNLGGGVFGMFGGDGDGNGQIQTQDKNEVWNLLSGQSGYLPGDFDLNGQVQTQDKNEIWNPNSGVASQVP